MDGGIVKYIQGDNEFSLDGREVLTRNLDQYVAYACKQTNIWRVIYYIERSLMIVFSVLTSADALNSLPYLTGYKSLFGVIVLLLTSFDVWLKPETKYKGYYQANDEYEDLRRSVKVLLKNGDEKGLKDTCLQTKQAHARLQALL
jgi:hypothetical protein